MLLDLPNLRFSRWLIALLILAPGTAAGQGAGAPAPVTVAKPVVKQITEWDEFIGRFQAVNEVEIRSRVTGYLDKIHFKDGQMVKEGELLFTIDRRPYQATYEEANASLVSAKARLVFAQGDLERAEALRRGGNISEQVLDQRRQGYNTARADVDRAEATLRQARLNLEFTEIKAPFGGRISRRELSVGNLIVANETILTNVVSVDPIHFYFDVDERSYLAYVRMAEEGTRPSSRKTPNEVYITVDLRNSSQIVGRMDFVDNRLDAGSGTMRGRAVVENHDLSLTPGQFGRVRIMGSGEYQGVLIPDEAIGSDQDRRVVYVVDKDNQLTMKPIRPGPRIDGYRVVREGLDGSETVVVNGLARVRPGMKIDPKPTELPPTQEGARTFGPPRRDK